MQNYWIWIRLSERSEDRIETLRTKLATAIPDAFREESDPHISVLPGISIPERRAERFRETVDTARVQFDTVRIAGIEYYPPDAPSVITLDVSTDLGRLRSTLLECVEAVDGDVEYSPVDPHLTLFKTGDDPSAWQLTDTEQREELDRRIDALTADSEVPTHWEDRNFTLEFSTY